MNATLPEPGRVIAGKYRIESVISRGGMGAIFAARNGMTGGRVALKWMLPKLLAEVTARERFIREAQLGARIEHPNVVPVFDIGEDDGSLFLVMALLEGESLGARLSRGPLAPPEAVRVMAGALRGVAAAHAIGVVHRDLKPDNIFLANMPDGRAPEPKVLDFGISKIHEAQGEIDLGLTGAGALLGTPHYMAEEQVRSAVDVDARADTYAMGVILYECLTGRRPFNGESLGDLVLQIATETPTPVGHLVMNLDPGLADITMRAMSRARDRRFVHAGSFADALVPFLTITATPTPSQLGSDVVQSLAAAQVAHHPVPTPLSSRPLPTPSGRHALATPTDGSFNVGRTPFSTVSNVEAAPNKLPRTAVMIAVVLALAVLGLGALALVLLTGDHDASEPAAVVGAPPVTVPSPGLPIATPPTHELVLENTREPVVAAPPVKDEIPLGMAAPDVEEAAPEETIVRPIVRPSATKSKRSGQGGASTRTRAPVVNRRAPDEGLDPWANDIGRAWDLGDEPDAPRRAPARQ